MNLINITKDNTIYGERKKMHRYRDKKIQRKRKLRIQHGEKIQ
jgi:hypothetical protein